MKLINLIPADTKDPTETLIRMLNNMAYRIDSLENINLIQREDIDYKTEVLEAFHRRSELHDGYINVDSIFRSDPDYQLIKDFIKEEVDDEHSS